MAIRVTCPGCHKRFQVSDQHAGKSGPCPNCKTVIRVPTKDEEVKIKGPEGLGAGVRGAVTTELIFRTEAKFSPVMAASIAVGVLAVLIVTAILGQTDFFATHAVLKSTVALLLISPPLVVAGYWFLRDEEDLGRYEGRDFYLRTAICSVLYMALWGLYAGYLTAVAKGRAPDEVFVLILLFAALASLGAGAAYVSFELDFGRGISHYCFFLFVTAMLRGLAGMGWIWETPEVLEPWEVPPVACSILVGSCLVGSAPGRDLLARWRRRRPRWSPPEEPNHRPPPGEGS